MEWKAVYYNGLETNIEVTKCGRVKKVQKEWYGFSKRCTNATYGEVDFSKLKLHPKGYRQICIQIKGLKPRNVRVQQLIAAAFLGYQFDGMKTIADHKDNNPLNNHLDNIQIITNRENCSKDRWRHKKSGLPIGVYFNKNANKYQAEIIINKKYNYLGLYNTPEEASNAYQTKLKEINT